MNANELANNLDKHYTFKKQFPQTADDVISTLRHLQAENESLKDKLMLARQSLEIVEGWTKK